MSRIQSNLLGKVNLAEHLLVDLPFFQPVDSVPQQCTFVCHTPERSVTKARRRTCLHLIAQATQVSASVIASALEVPKGGIHKTYHKISYTKKKEKTCLLSPVVEETRFVSLNYYNIEQIPPIFSNNIAHSTVPEETITQQ